MSALKIKDFDWKFKCYRLPSCFAIADMPKPFQWIHMLSRWHFHGKQSVDTLLLFWWLHKFTFLHCFEILGKMVFRSVCLRCALGSTLSRIILVAKSDDWLLAGRLYPKLFLVRLFSSLPPLSFLIGLLYFTKFKYIASLYMLWLYIIYALRIVGCTNELINWIELKNGHPQVLLYRYTTIDDSRMCSFINDIW